MKICIIRAKFNETITTSLVEGAVQAAVDEGVSKNDIDTFEVDGAFELPLMAQTAVRTKRYDAVVAMGCVIRGETAHFDFISSESARGLMNVGLEAEIPVIFGVLTTENAMQARERSGLGERSLNRGADVMVTAIRSVRTMNEIQKGSL